MKVKLTKEGNTSWFQLGEANVVNYENKRFYLYPNHMDWFSDDVKSPVKTGLIPEKRSVNYDFADNEFDHLLICVTNRCNIVCDYCFRGFNMKKIEEISYDDLIKAADFFVENSKKKVTFQFTGGEVFVRKDIEDIFEYLHERGFRIWMTTNGVSDIIHKSERLRKIFQDNPKAHVRVSLDGHNAKLYEKHRGGPGTFAKVEKNLKYLVSIGVPVSIKTVITTENYMYIEEILDWAYELGLSGWNYNVVRYTGAMSDTPPEDSTAKAKGTLDYVGYELIGKILTDVLIRKPYLAPLVGISRYGKILDTLYGSDIHGVHMMYYVLNYDGNVYVNDNLYSPTHRRGNIWEDGMKAFNGLEKIREHLDLSLPACTKCPISRFCFQKGDYGELSQKDHSLKKEFPNCPDIRSHFFYMMSLGENGKFILKNMDARTYGRPVPV